jgi:hypothetical protein
MGLGSGEWKGPRDEGMVYPAAISAACEADLRCGGVSGDLHATDWALLGSALERGRGGAIVPGLLLWRGPRGMTAYTNLTNDPSRKGELAAPKRLFGEFSRYAVAPVHARSNGLCGMRTSMTKTGVLRLSGRRRH